MLIDIHHELDKVVKKIFIPSTKNERIKAVEKSTFENLKEKAVKAGNNYFFRKGTSCQWVNSYSNDAKEQFWKFEDITLLEELGYPPF